MTKFPLPAASTGEVTASADDLVVPCYARSRRTSIAAESLVPSAVLAAGASRLAAILDKDITPTPGCVTNEYLGCGIVITFFNTIRRNERQEVDRLTIF